MPKVSTAAAEAPAITINQNVTPTEKPVRKEKEKIEFWSYMASLSPQDWKRHIVYLYRTKPVVGMVKEKYLDKFMEPFTIEDVRSRFGGEEFKAIMQRDHMMFHTEVFSIEAAPKFDSTRENPSANASGAASQERIIEKLLDERNGSSEIENKAQDRALDLVTKAYDKAAEKLGGGGAGGGSDIVATIRVLKDLGLIGQPPPPQRSVIAEMKDMMELAKTMGFMGGGNALTGLKEQIELVKTLADAVGSGGGGGGKADIWGTLVSKAPEIIDGLGNIVGKVKDVQSEATRQLDIKARTATQIAQINAQRAAQGQPPLPAESVAPAAENVSAAPHPAGGLHTVSVDQAAAAHAPANGSTAISNDQQEQVLANFLKHRVVEMISKYQDPDGALDPAAYTAADVLTWVEDFDPRIVEFLSTLGPGGFEQFFTNDPILSAAVALPQWPKWFSEACDDLYAEAAAAQPARPQ